MPTDLLTIRGTTGVELQGVYVKFVNAVTDGNTTADDLYPGSQLMARVELVWQTQAQLLNFITAFNTSSFPANVSDRKNQVIISLPNMGIARLAWLAVPFESTGSGTRTMAKKKSLLVQPIDTANARSSPTLEIAFPLVGTGGAVNTKVIRLVHCTPIGAGGQISADNFLFINHASYVFARIEIV